MSIGERIRQLRHEKHMTLEQVAEKTCLTRATIQRYEAGTIKVIPPERVHQLANLFGVTRPYIMGWTDERNANPSENLDMVARKLRENEENTVRWKPANSSDCITAATQALRALNKFKISRTPIYPQQILQASMIATMLTFDGVEESEEGYVTIIKHAEMQRKDGSPHHLFYVDQNAPIGHMSLTLAEQLGHIYLGHNEDRMDDGKDREAECFAIHLLFPRPIIKLLMERGYVFTRKSFAQIFGYCDWCIDSITNAPPVNVSPELNHIVKEQFDPYVKILEEMGRLTPTRWPNDEPLDLNRYMAGYEE